MFTVFSCSISVALALTLARNSQCVFRSVFRFNLICVFVLCSSINRFGERKLFYYFNNFHFLIAVFDSLFFDAEPCVCVLMLHFVSIISLSLLLLLVLLLGAVICFIQLVDAGGALIHDSRVRSDDITSSGCSMFDAPDAWCYCTSIQRKCFMRGQHQQKSESHERRARHTIILLAWYKHTAAVTIKPCLCIRTTGAWLAPGINFIGVEI